MKVYIDRNNIQVELIRFRKKIATLLTLETLKWDNFFVFMKFGSLLSARCRHSSVKIRALRSNKGFRLFYFPANKELGQLWNIVL